VPVTGREKLSFPKRAADCADRHFSHRLRRLTQIAQIMMGKICAAIRRSLCNVRLFEKVVTRECGEHKSILCGKNREGVFL
jgi:hypothetical protein